MPPRANSVEAVTPNTSCSALPEAPPAIAWSGSP